MGEEKFSQHNVRVPLQLRHRCHGEFLRVPFAYGVVAEHVRIKVVIAAVVINFRDGVPGQKPDACIGKTGCFVDSLQQRGDVIAQAKSVTVQEPDRIQDLPGGLFVSPSGNVIPEAGLDETAIGEEETPNGFGLFSPGGGLSLFTDPASQRVQVAGVDLPLLQNFR